MIRIFVTIILISLLAGCSTIKIDYQSANSMSVQDASETLEQLIMTQHPKFRPDDMAIYDKYIVLARGSVTKSKGGGGVVGGVVVSRSTSTSRLMGDRIYYNVVKNINIWHWRNKNYYYVETVDKNGVFTRFYFTQSLSDAQLAFDALSTLVSYYKNREDK